MEPPFFVDIEPKILDDQDDKEDDDNDDVLLPTFAALRRKTFDTLYHSQNKRETNNLDKSPKGSVDEASFAEYLDTADMPDVDLLIRTGGHHRISNFLPWQTTYAEMYFTDVKWPAFSEAELSTAVEWFGEQQRNKGK